MKVQQITVSLGATISLGNYSNIQPRVTVTGEIDNEDPAAAHELLTHIAQRALKHEIEVLTTQQDSYTRANALEVIGIQTDPEPDELEYSAHAVGDPDEADDYEDSDDDRELPF